MLLMLAGFYTNLTIICNTEIFMENFIQQTVSLFMN